MNTPEIRGAVVDALRAVAPESDPASLGDAARLRDELDLDSMDFLNFVVALHTTLHVDIPEADYPKVQTMGDAVRYLALKVGAS
jgi:acyl carrier protein